MSLRTKLLTCGRNIAYIRFRSTRELTYSLEADVRLSHPAEDASLFRRAHSLRTSSIACHRWSSSTSSDVDHYHTLGVPPAATAEEIKSAFYELSKIHHPDVSTSSRAVEEFMKIRQAWEVLGDPDKKRKYDKTRPNRVVEDRTFPDPGWEEEEEAERKARERRRADQEIAATMADLKRARERSRVDDKEYQNYKAYHESLSQNEQDSRSRRRNFAKYAMADSDVAFSAGLILLVVLIELCRYFYYKTGLPKTTVTYEEFVSNIKKEGRNDMSHYEWLQSDFSRREKWNQNIENLPEMMQEERKVEQELLKRRYLEEEYEENSE